MDNLRCEIRKIRNRDEVLRALLPGACWILGKRGRQKFGYSGVSAELPGEIVLCVSPLPPYRVAISVYAYVDRTQKKVFSAHVTNKPQCFDPGFYKNCDGCVGVMSWRRGEWENIIMAESVGLQEDLEKISKTLFRPENMALH